MTKRALISVSDKAGIVEFAQELKKLGWDIISTGGTKVALDNAGVETIAIDDVTGFPEMMDGRVKTLHPNIHGGLLARRDLDSHLQAAKDNHIELIEPTFLRGKRIGSVITMDCLDAETAEKFIRSTFTAEEGYTIDDDLSEVCNYIQEAEIAPAFMAEIVESTKSKLIFTEETHVTSFHIKASVESYQRQLGLASKKAVVETPAERLVNALKLVLGTEKLEAITQMCEYEWELDRKDYSTEKKDNK